MKVKDLVNNGATVGYLVRCPACDEAGFGNLHSFAVRMPGGGPGWSFDGNYEAPTFSPSMLARCPSNGRIPQATYVCHSFVRNGRIEYLGDCTHGMAGTMVDLPDWDEDEDGVDGADDSGGES